MMKCSIQTFAVLFVWALGAGICRAEGVTLGPVIGAVDHARAVVWIRHQDESPLTLTVRDSDDMVIHEAQVIPSRERDFCCTSEIVGLKSDAVYQLSYRAKEAAEVAQGSFRTAPAPSVPSRCKIAIGSCASESFPEIWKRMAFEGVDVVALCGDTPYIDSSDLGVNRRRHREFLAQPGLIELLRTRPMVGTWDDHDFGGNDSDGRSVDREVIRQVFLEYRPLATAGEDGQGIYTSLRRGPVELFLIDARYFSQAEPSPVMPDKPTLLGRRQWDWLRRSLAESTAPFKLLITGMVWHDKPNKEKDDWETYAYERDALFRWIGEQQINGVMLVGGDVHVSLRLLHDTAGVAGYSIPEFVSSPLHAKLIPKLVPTKEKGLQWSAVEPNVFLLVDADSTLPEPTLIATWIRQDGTRLHEYRIDASDLALLSAGSR